MASKKHDSASDAANRLRAFALSYPGAHPKSPWPGHADVAVNDKTFVYLSAEGSPFGISCKLPTSSAGALQVPYTLPTPYGLGKSGWVSCRPPAGTPLPVELFEEWIDESYRAQAPKKRVKELDERDSAASEGRAGTARGVGAVKGAATKGAERGVGAVKGAATKGAVRGVGTKGAVRGVGAVESAGAVRGVGTVESAGAVRGVGTKGAVRGVGAVKGAGTARGVGTKGTVRGVGTKGTARGVGTKGTVRSALGPARSGAGAAGTATAPPAPPSGANDAPAPKRGVTKRTRTR